MSVSLDAIEVLRAEVGETNVDEPGSARAWEILALCDIAIDGYAEGRAAIEYARARGLTLTGVRFMEPFPAGAEPAERFTPAQADALLARGDGIRFELFPGADAAYDARWECEELIAKGWRTA